MRCLIVVLFVSSVIACGVEGCSTGEAVQCKIIRHVKRPPGIGVDDFVVEWPNGERSLYRTRSNFNWEVGDTVWVPRRWYQPDDFGTREAAEQEDQPDEH